MELLKELNYQGKEVRILELEGKPYFVGKDVAELLGYSNPNKAIRDHVKTSISSQNESFTQVSIGKLL